MATEMTFSCTHCAVKFPLRLGAVKSDFIGGKQGEMVEARDAAAAKEFMDGVIAHRCEGKNIVWSGDVAKID